MSDDYLWDGTGDPDPTVRDMEQVLSVLRYDRDFAPPARRSPRRMLVATGIAVAFAAGVALGITAFSRATPVAPELATASDDGATVAAPGAGAREAPPPPETKASAGVLDPWSGVKRAPAPSAAPRPSTGVLDPFDDVLSPGEAASIVRSRASALRGPCFDPLLSAGKVTSGARLTLALSIAPDGAVRSAVAKGDTSPGGALGRCVVREARRWRFPKAGSSSTVQVPLIFTATPAKSADDPGVLDPWGKSATVAPSTAPRTASDVRRVVSQNVPLVKQRCWTKALAARSPDAPDSAKTSLKITIGPSGAVSAASAADPPGYPGLGSCIAGQARAWRFPKASSSTTVSVPFVFSAR